MTTALLDVNVLIAILDVEHKYYERATLWYTDHAGAGWASCPLTQNGAVRILSGPGYPQAPGSAAAVAKVLAELCARPEHRFWPDSLSLLDPAHVDQGRMPESKHLTDTYLLALAKANSGRLVTFDRKLQTAAVPDGERYLEVIAA